MIKFILFIFFLFYSFNSYGYEKIHVAVASNFIEPLNSIKKEFLKNNKTSFNISSGSTTKLFAQILNKAPIDIFLSADQSTIQKIPDNKKIKVSKFTYAIGSLIIFSKAKIDNQIKFENKLLKRLSNKIVIANPKFSPYGRASKQVLESLGMLSLFENKIILAGNGGSAADCQHIAGELVSRFMFDRPGLPSVALTTDTSILTAIGNDYGYENVFSRQIEAHASSNDTLIVYTTSGESPNILKVVESAKPRLKSIIAMTGKNFELLNQYCDVIISVDSLETSKIQEVHAIAGHMICESVEHILFDKN